MCFKAEILRRHNSKNIPLKKSTQMRKCCTWNSMRNEGTKRKDRLRVKKYLLGPGLSFPPTTQILPRSAALGKADASQGHFAMQGSNWIPSCTRVSHQIMKWELISSVALIKYVPCDHYSRERVRAASSSVSKASQSCHLQPCTYICHGTPTKILYR